MNRTIERFKIILLIAVILYVAHLAYIHGFIFEGDHWQQQTNCEVNCNRVLHPSYLHLILFSGTCIAVGLTIFSDFIPSKSPVSKIKYHIKQQIDEIKAMDSIQFELCFRSSFLVICIFLLGLLIIQYLVWHNCSVHSYQSACYTDWFNFTYVLYRVLAFIILWYFPKIISSFFKI